MPDIVHSQRRLTETDGWVAYVSEMTPRRLIVFVHGFRGHSVKTWRRFSESGEVGLWWRESDLLFVGYDSTRESITGIASRVREQLPIFYPRPPSYLLQVGDARVRDEDGTYDELYLVGHSLGGVVVRRALADAAQTWSEAKRSNPNAQKPVLLDARVRLFSPASAGFRAAGLLGLMKASPGWLGVEMYLRRSSAFSDLQPDSELLASTRRRTERFVNEDELTYAALRARIVWANPDNVVVPERYDSDYLDTTAQDTNHSSVCKPNDGYRLPWVFVETGSCT